MKRLATGAAFAALLALAACTAQPAPPADTTASPAPSAAAAEVTNVYYPVAIGNTWTYRMAFPDPIGVVTETETMTAMSPEGDGMRVTTERSFHHENGAVPDYSDSVDYVFHDNGSIDVPYQTVPDASGARVVVTGGTMVWPTVDEFEAGIPKTGTITAEVTTAGATYEQSVDFTVAGAGTQDVTVAAGTFAGARALKQDLLISIPSLGVSGLPVSATTWLAEGTGPVKTEVADVLGTGPIVVELVKFTPGE